MARRQVAIIARIAQAVTLVLLVANSAIVVSRAAPSPTEPSTFKTYAAVAGLTSLAGYCLAQGRVNELLICSEHGLFTYDGRRFVNLGPEQGLRDGGIIEDLAVLPDGRIAAAFSNEVLLSDGSPSAAQPLSSLRFLPIEHPGIVLLSTHAHRLAPWRDGLVLLTEEDAVRVAIPRVGPAHVETLDYSDQERAELAHARSLFVIRGHLWETFDDGRICAADPGDVTCFGTSDGLRGGPWVDLVPDRNGTLLARSISSVASFEPASHRWTVAALPDQGGRYVEYQDELSLVRAPDGALVTQADHGLVMRDGMGWRPMAVAQGAPSGIVSSAMTDAAGQFWFQILGRGLVRWIGFGRWETLNQSGGLSAGLPWETARLPDGTLWVTTDTGLDEIAHEGSELAVSKVMPGDNFAVAAGPRGRLWVDDGARGLKILDPHNWSQTPIGLPAVHVIRAGTNGTMWVGTRSGLFRVSDPAGLTPHPTLVGPSDERVIDICSDGAGGIFYLSGDNLRHRDASGADRPIGVPWLATEFEPRVLALGRDRTLWVSGPEGLFHVLIRENRVAAAHLIPPADTQTNSIPALLVDHRGWLWAGTSSGVSVFDGHRWVSINTDSGLVSNDVNEGGLREDPDGSIWIVTSGGISHLLDPAWVFSSPRPDAFVADARLGVHPLPDGRIPYTKEPLSLDFGSSTFSAEDSLTFRYRLSGVDAGWQMSASGEVRYASVPPGHHVLTVLAEDELTHRSSDPVTLAVDLGYPWWRQGWFELLAGLLGICFGMAALYSLQRIRFRAMYARQAQLSRLVANATRELSEAKERAEYQAAHDQLTGLLTRCEVERRLAASLAAGRNGEEMAVALLDADHFKKINDEYGHLGGDDVLRGLSQLVSRAIQDGEYAGRYGGEEILIVLDDHDGRAAERILGLHFSVRHAALKADRAPVRVTCSIGIAWAMAGDNWESLVRRADQALYEAKRGGRDQVVEAPAPEIARPPDGRPGMS